MATWHGKPHTYMLETIAEGGYLDYGPVEYNWEYGTCADVLMIKRTEPGKEPAVEYFGNAEAIAHMETLLDWFATYEGMENLEALVAAIKESKK